MVGFYYMLAKTQRRNGERYVSYVCDALAPIVAEISRFLENKAFAVAFLNRELGVDSGKQLLKIITIQIHRCFVRNRSCL